MNILTPGIKVYSYCFGPMTVKEVNGKYITASVDKPEGFSLQFEAQCKECQTDLNSITMLTAAFGHWYFDSPTFIDQRKENNDFPEAAQQAGSPRALNRNPEYLHVDFGGKREFPLPTPDGGISGLTVKGGGSGGLTAKGDTSGGLTAKNNSVSEVAEKNNGKSSQTKKLDAKNAKEEETESGLTAKEAKNSESGLTAK